MKFNTLLFSLPNIIHLKYFSLKQLYEQIPIVGKYKIPLFRYTMKQLKKIFD